MKHFNALTLALLLSTTASAAEVDSTLVEHLSAWQQVNTEAQINPALNGKTFRTDFSQLSLQADFQRQKAAFTLQEGTGHTLYSIDATTYLHLNNVTTVWGKALYHTGTARGIRFNSIADYSLMEPYILADTDGGKTKRERYEFQGGYATQLNRWLLGAEMLFRADHEYRTFDPRMRAIVTDLTLRGGAAYQWRGYRWGAAAELNIYKQTDDVTFMREEGVIAEYQLTGLGATYARFSGEVNRLYYKGGGARLLLNLQPESGNGFFANLSMSEHSYERIAASLNSLPLTKLYRDQWKTTLGYRQRKNTDWALWIDASLTRRMGDENIVGSSLSNNYPILARLTMYRNTISDASLSAMYGHSAKQDWHVGITIGYLDNNEKYRDPKREMGFSRLYARLWGQYLDPIGRRTTLSAKASADYLKNLDSTFQIPVTETEPALMAMLTHNYKYLRADYTCLDAQMRIDHRLKQSRLGLFCQLSAGTILTSESGTDTHANLTLGLTF